MFQRSEAPLDIDVLMIPDATLISLASVIEPLRGANRVSARENYRWRLVTPEGGPAVTASGVTLPNDGRFDPTRLADAVFVIASYGASEHTDRDLPRRLNAAGRRERMVCGVESGGWLMARAGLLDGRRATVHWEDLDDFAARFPDTEVCDDRYVIDGARVTTGGASPALDLMLRLIAARQGEALAMSVARLFIYDRGAREDATRAPADFADLRRRDPRVAIAVELMHANLAEPLPIAAIARRAGVGPRRLQSLFQSFFGLGPRDYYLGLRLDASRRLLRESHRPIYEVAERCGFTSASAFARAYRRRYRETPGAIRQSRS